MILAYFRFHLTVFNFVVSTRCWILTFLLTRKSSKTLRWYYPTSALNALKEAIFCFVSQRTPVTFPGFSSRNKKRAGEKSQKKSSTKSKDLKNDSSSWYVRNTKLSSIPKPLPPSHSLSYGPTENRSGRRNSVRSKSAPS